MQPAGQKKKYNIDEYISSNKANAIIKNFNKDKKYLNCMCDPKDDIKLPCFKCKESIHNCIAIKPNRRQLYQCAACLNKSLDPLVQVRKVLVQSYFRTSPIFDCINIINFQFFLDQQDLGYSIEVRGLVPQSTSLTWPMQGSFFINDNKTSIHDLKPLLYNSNRKSRRQEYFSIPNDKLKAGKNIITFKIPCLDKNKFTSRYQHQDRKNYYMAVNSVQRLSSSDLETQTFRQRRIEKMQSINLLKTNNGQIQVFSNKVCLICPYTKDRIKVPVRGRYCKHFSCICLQTLISSHSASRYWGCPICQLKINQPYVDVWIYNMLKDNQSGSDVIVKQDGSYEWIKPAIQEAMSLEDDDEDSPPMKLPTTSKPKPEVKNIVKAQIIKDEIKNKEETKKTKPIEKNVSTIDLDIIDLDDSVEESQNKQKKNQIRKQIAKKTKQLITKDLILTSQQKQKDNLLNPQSKKKQQKSISKPRGIITDIKILQCRQMRLQQFKKIYLKTKINPYRKYLNAQQLKKIFKQII